MLRQIFLREVAAMSGADVLYLDITVEGESSELNEVYSSVNQITERLGVYVGGAGTLYKCFRGTQQETWQFEARFDQIGKFLGEISERIKNDKVTLSQIEIETHEVYISKLVGEVA